MIGVEFVKDKKHKEPYAPEIGICHKVTKEAMERGVIVYPGSGTADGIVGDHILLMPPFIIKQEQIDGLVSILGETIKIVEKKYPP